ncbi:hypothetical protein KC333_g9088 [Hortaea werneckii]|nr:hypothetical protein KC333_g9088 [Hortaea werneckii]KAI7301931.1 hypothetical protein KC326_g9087 [Hortaea werneckii]
MTLAPPVPAVFPSFPDLKGKVALITGLTTGIGQVGSPDSDTWGNGAAAARLLVHNGVKILGCDLHLSSAERTKQRLLNERPEAAVDVFACDVTKPDEVKAFVAAAVEKHGRLDILVNNVGLTAAGNPETMSHETWSRQIDINLTCNCVVPGLMYTPLVENFAQSKDPGDQEAARRIKDHNVPMGWMGTGEDVANAVAWLASGASRYVTAHALVVDGGITQSTGTGFQAQE